MARDPDALKIRKWGALGQSNRADIPAELRRLGWFYEYSLDGGIPGPERVVFNQILAELTALSSAVNTYGVPLPWSSRINYRHVDGQEVSFATGSTGLIYVSVKPSGPATNNSANPINDADHTCWRPY